MCVDLSLKKFYLSFWIFCIIYRFTGSQSNSFLMLLLTFSKIIFHFSNNLSSFIKKDKYLVSSKSLLYKHIFGKNMQKSRTFLASLWPIKYLKLVLPKDTLLDTTISLISIFFAKIKLLCWSNFWFSISVLPNFITFYSSLYILSKFVTIFFNL